MNKFNFDGTIYAFNQTEWFWLIPTFVLIAIFLSFIKNKKTTEPASLANTHNDTINVFHPLADITSSQLTKKNSRWVTNVFYFFIFSLIVLAMSQPIKIGKKMPDPPRERDIIFIVDTSVSMILRDYILNGERIDRMSLLKVVVSDFIQNLKGQRMSIVVFGDHAYTLVPLTADQALLQNMVSRIQATMAGRFNAMGEGIALAVKQAVDTKKNNDRKTILVLLTDADQPTGNISPLLAAELAKKEKLPLYSIAIGANSLAAEEKDRQGGLLYSPVDIELIKKLASITGATHFQAGNTNALKNAVNAINSHQTNKAKIKPRYYQQPLYYWFLILAVVLYSLSQVYALLLNFIHNHSNSNEKVESE